MRKRNLFLYIVLYVFVIGIMIYSFINTDYDNVYMCLLTLILFLIPTIVDRKLNIKLPTVLESIIILFIFAAEIAGEIGEYYLRVPYWDIILHTINGFIMAAIGFSMIDILNNSPKLHFNMSPIFVAFVSFCFSMTIGVLWEFFEYFMDILTNTDMQKDIIMNGLSSVTLNTKIANDSVIITDITKTIIEGNVDGITTKTIIDGGYLDIGLYDTMIDLIVNCVGALVFSAFGILYIKGRSRFAKSFIPEINTKE